MNQWLHLAIELGPHLLTIYRRIILAESPALASLDEGLAYSPLTNANDHNHQLCIQAQYSVARTSVYPNALQYDHIKP